MSELRTEIFKLESHIAELLAKAEATNDPIEKATFTAKASVLDSRARNAANSLSCHQDGGQKGGINKRKATPVAINNWKKYLENSSDKLSTRAIAKSIAHKNNINHRCGFDTIYKELLKIVRK